MHPVTYLWLGGKQLRSCITFLLASIVFLLTAIFASAQQPETTPQPSAKLFLAASGPADQLPAVLDGFTDYLAAKNVRTKQLGAEPKSRGVALDELTQKGGAYLLFLTFDFAPNRNLHATLTIQCFDATGKKLWEEETKGGMFMVNQSSYIKGMIKNGCKKLDAHVGNEGLPADAPK